MKEIINMEQKTYLFIYLYLFHSLKILIIYNFFEYLLIIFYLIHFGIHFSLIYLFIYYYFFYKYHHFLKSNEHAGMHIRNITQSDTRSEAPLWRSPGAIVLQDQSITYWKECGGGWGSGRKEGKLWKDRYGSGKNVEETEGVTERKENWKDRYGSGISLGRWK